MDAENEWKTNPIHALRLIRRLSNVNFEDEVVDAEDLVARIHSITDLCLDAIDLVDTDSDKELQRPIAGIIASEPDDFDSGC